MTFSLRRKRRTTRPAKSTPSRTACRLLAAAAGLALASAAAAQDGQPASSFRPRADGPPAALILPAQAKTGPSLQPGTTQPGTTQPGTTPPGTPPRTTPPGTVPPGTPPGTVPGGPLGKGIPPLGAPGTPPTGPGKTPGTTDPLPGGPGVGPPKGPGAGGGPADTGLPPMGTRAGQDPYEAYIRLEPPGRERLFGSRDTERELEERMRQERRDTGSNDTIVFPEKPKLTDQAYQPRQFAPMVEVAEPNYVVYRRLYFEEKNSERYGWDLGPAQPIVSALAFFKDTLLFPHNFASYPCRRFETSAGYCQPGDPVPYLCYPPELTGSGLLAETGLIYLLYVAIP